METAAASWMPLDLIGASAALPYGGVIVAVLIGAISFTIVALSVPGALTPTAFVSGLLMGFGGALVVALGAALGSHLLFLVSRRWLAAAMQRRFGARLDGVRDHLERRGPIYVATARLGGVPHIVVTAGAAATQISARSFAGASILGMLPAISLAAIAGSAF